MKKHYDVGVYGWWGHDNFGGCLTYFALNKVLQRMGYSVLMIQEGNGIAPRYNISDDCIAMRFAKKYYDCSPQVKINELHKFNDICDRFVTGGDQLWNYKIGFVKDDNFLDFVSDSKHKISYSTSFGNKDHNPSLDYRIKTSRLLKKMDAISVREDYAVAIARDVYKVPATKVIDAVFLLDKLEYEKIANEGDAALPEKYILSFILNPSEKKKKQIEAISQKLGLPVVCIPDAARGFLEKIKEMFAGFTILQPLSVENFLKAYSNASYIITDSFHGTCFSYIFRKPFSVYFNTERGADRFYSLMKVLQLDSRRIDEDWTVDEINVNYEIGFDIDWTVAEKNVANARMFSLSWLNKAMDTNNSQSSKCTIEALDTNMCMGCGACVSACPVEAISFTQDKYGYYRSDVNLLKCIRCGKCKNICPAINLPKNQNKDNPKIYAFQHANEEILKNSSSGGAFTALAEGVLKKKGIVFGAAWGDDFVVKHVGIEDMQGLEKLRKSKYTQSYIGDVLKQVKFELKKGRETLFVGCPCQVAGLKSYLEKDYDNLILVDLLCGNAPSNKFFKRYMDENFGINNVASYSFRDKTMGWPKSYAGVEIIKRDGTKIVRNEMAQDEYQTFYHPHTMCPQHCQHCKYQNRKRFGDLTIGDFWGIDKKDKEINSFLGVSAVLVNNSKGESVLNSIPASIIGLIKEEPREYLGYNGYAPNGHRISPNRDKFYNLFETKTFKDILHVIRDVEKCPTNKQIEKFGQDETVVYSSYLGHFQYNPEWFTNEIKGGVEYVYVKPGCSKLGIRAYMPMRFKVEKGKTYEVKIRFKTHTNCQQVNLHMYDSTSGALQVIKTVDTIYSNDKFCEVVFTFSARLDNVDSFMIGACHLTGEKPYFALDYMTIKNK